MKTVYILLTLFLLSNCTNQNRVFWCGDHACKNKKEKEAYFKKTMIVEVKSAIKSEDKKESNLENEILKKDKKKIKKIEDQTILNEEKRLKEESELIKEVILEEEKLKEEKKIFEQATLNNEKKAVNESNINIANVEVNSKSINQEFDVLVKKITNKNLNKPFPNINDIPK